MVLACLLVDNSLLYSSELANEDFFSYQEEFGFISAKIYHKGCDSIMFGSKFDNYKVIEYTAEVVGGSSFFNQYIKELKGYTEKRNCITARDKINRDPSYDTLLSAVNQVVKKTKGEVYAGSMLVREYEKYIDNPLSTKKVNILGLDKTCKFKETQLISVVARPGVGKTTLALQMALNAVRGKQEVLFITMEMSHNELTNKLVSQITGHTVDEIEDGKVSAEEVEKAKEEIKGMGNFKVSVVADRKISKIVSAIKRENIDKKIDIVIIDYVQLVRFDHDKYNETERVSEACKIFKGVAMEENVCIFNLGQINREGAKATVPQLHNIKSSSAVEEDSNKVIIIHRPTDDHGLHKPEGLLFIAKNREGRTGRVDISFDGIQFRRIDSIDDIADKVENNLSIKG